ncbi:hypothetical protein VTN77DRAFT_1555 [Rasamsonia byssochlamydoides]|uniref:uncharacterized protein n=1 Tax=Rasamsonia byssochlamydoides TaxID=89139 RepID=UPI0037448067
MSEGGKASHPNLNLTPEEKRVFYQLFQAADTTNLGVITGEVAVPFFEKTKLPPDTLGLIWQIADKENRGLLTPSGFSMVLRLIGHAQAGRAPTEELALQPGPLPRFEGLTDAPPSRPSTASPPPPGPVRVPPLNPDDVNKFKSLFEKSETHNGVISGETAKQIFERARLPNEILGRIWNLADTKQRGQLDLTEFIIAMHLLTSYKTGAMRGIPQSLPPGLYEAASRRAVRTSTSSRPGSDIPPVPAIPSQFTGPQRTQSPLSRQPFASPLSAQSTGGDWLITPQEKAHFDSIFETVDTAKAGVISGDQAVVFFTNAQLPEEVLAQIWDLADIDADGQLTKDEFAVAMYLVRQQRSKKEPLPPALPPALVPPSMRRQVGARPVQSPVSAPVPAPAPAAPAPAPAPVPRSAAEDLFGLDAFSSPAPAAPAQLPQSTGGSNPPFQSPGSPASRTSQQGPSTTFKPFVPSSQFGQSLNPQLTGVGATPRSPPPPSDDLLGDNDPEESKKLTQETTDLANLSNQIGSLAKEMQNVQTQRASAEQEFSQTSQQKRDFEARLAQARTMYEKEVKDFKALEERLNASRAETKKLQQEYALLEGSRQDLQNQYDQVSAALAADQNENAALKEKIRQVNAEINQLKPALEKARSEARQQKGLVAINKKQLATVEAERDRIQGEIDTLVKEKQEAEEPPASVVTSAADVSSPALSTASQQTNPFFRRTTTGSPEKTLSPQQSAFDNIFGPAFSRPSTATPPPPTSFRAGSPSVQQARDASKSPDTSGIPTPSVSPPPSTGRGNTSEPPPPPLSRQITPSFLPPGDEVQAPSATSSRAVSPPASRFGAPDTSGAGTPLRPTTSNGGTNDKSAARSPFDGAQEPSTTEDNEENREAVASPKEDSKQPFPSMPGDFPTETSTGAEGPSAPAKDPSFDELFGNVGRERSQSQKANDFEEAFAGMKPRANGASEFPPIREFDNDDDDESTDSDAPLGFDDNFNPSSPLDKEGHSKSDSIDAAQLSAFPAPGTGQPPPAGAQSPPPNYESKKEAGDFPREFDGLVPSRADPTRAPDAPHAVESSTGAPIVAGEAQKKAGAPDFDAAFAGLNLAPAKEEDDSDDDEADSQFNKNANDFDFSFDSPSQPPKESGASGAAASDFFNFDNNVHSSAAGGSAAQPSTGGNAPTTQHDWDAIFAPLQGAKAAEDESNGTAHPSESKAAPASENRQPGWALSTGSGEDDLILQRLTSMGYPRDEALAALEKFDYNIDKAADYLTSRS